MTFIPVIRALQYHCPVIYLCLPSARGTNAKHGLSQTHSSESPEHVTSLTHRPGLKRRSHIVPEDGILDICVMLEKSIAQAPGRAPGHLPHPSVCRRADSQHKLYASSDTEAYIRMKPERTDVHRQCVNNASPVALSPIPYLHYRLGPAWFSQVRHAPLLR